VKKKELEHKRPPKTKKQAYTHYTLKTYGNKHTLRICNSYFFYTTTMAAGKRPIFTLLYIACLAEI